VRDAGCEEISRRRRHCRAQYVASEVVATAETTPLRRVSADISVGVGWRGPLSRALHTPRLIWHHCCKRADVGPPGPPMDSRIACHPRSTRGVVTVPRDIRTAHVVWSQRNGAGRSSCRRAAMFAPAIGWPWVQTPRHGDPIAWPR
jgi:hypothetical protein